MLNKDDFLLSLRSFFSPSKKSFALYLEGKKKDGEGSDRCADVVRITSEGKKEPERERVREKE